MYEGAFGNSRVLFTATAGARNIVTGRDCISWAFAEAVCALDRTGKSAANPNITIPRVRTHSTRHRQNSRTYYWVRVPVVSLRRPLRPESQIIFGIQPRPKFQSNSVLPFCRFAVYPSPVPPDLSSEMLSAANSAVEHARKYWSTELDFSPRSLEDVELILARMHESIPRKLYQKLYKRGPTPEQMATLSLAYGAYLGEVIRREFGGTWSREEINSEPTIALVFTPQVKVFPPAKVWKRLNNGETDNIRSFYEIYSEMLRKERERGNS